MDTGPRRIPTSVGALAASAIIAATACGSTRPWGKARVVDGHGPQGIARTFSIVVSRDAFRPSEIEARAGERIRLRFERTSGSRCAREVIVILDRNHEIRIPLPVRVPVELVLELERPGELGFTCSMHMLGGTIDVRP